MLVVELVVEVVLPVLPLEILLLALHQMAIFGGNLMKVD
jgi:hypothetical protein